MSSGGGIIIIIHHVREMLARDEVADQVPECLRAKMDELLAKGNANLSGADIRFLLHCIGEAV